MKRLRVLGSICATAALTVAGVSALQAVVNPPLKELEKVWTPAAPDTAAAPSTIPSPLDAPDTQSSEPVHGAAKQTASAEGSGPSQVPEEPAPTTLPPAVATAGPCQGICGATSPTLYPDDDANGGAPRVPAPQPAPVPVGSAPKKPDGTGGSGESGEGGGAKGNSQGQDKPDSTSLGRLVDRLLRALIGGNGRQGGGQPVGPPTQVPGPGGRVGQ